ncbi:MAG: hypothetical protein COS25_02570 [Candidatus Nealsonbacteria bacterium CG02_land_8_20_14_3_00_37_10]|uniref:Uncharacterized protein n=2 Tax=Candidatus Nealsoniibacteriota TaxID=1817911 RepID=A0A2G9YXV1_9BACT|nr:MAG: hypothetical protein COX35_02675 [Candidatus Nealsonbacteria bacterium CG23_combo_of_CG06-09_8_20_14_all_37_18]PIV44936.1 MAG: hypothetical protein COS25_02570 [Candidatus Nealsonbacteria bacterium CG02_land_8_20_14_3_00_37_10]
MQVFLFLNSIYLSFYFLALINGLFFLILFDKKNKKESYYLLAPVIGTSILLNVLFVFYKLNISFNHTTLFIIAVGILEVIFLFRNRMKLTREKLKFIILSLVLLLICANIFSYPFYKENNTYPLGYYVNNDTVWHATVTDSINGKYTFFNTDEKADVILHGVRFGYPIGFHLIAAFFGEIINKKGFEVVHPIAAAILSLASMSIFFILNKRRSSLDYTVLLLSLLATFTFLNVGIFYVGFYPQMSLIPFLPLALFFYYKQFESIENNGNNIFINLLAALFTQAGIIIYGITILGWIIPLIFIISLSYFAKYKNKEFGLKYLKNIIILAFIIFLINPLSIINIINTVYKSIIAPDIGNTIGFISLKTAFNLNFYPDYRDYRAVGIIDNISNIALILFIALISVNIFMAAKQKNKFLLFSLLAALVPFLITRYITKSPYYNAKTVHYLSIFIFISLFSTYCINDLKLRFTKIYYVHRAIFLLSLLFILYNTYIVMVSFTPFPKEKAKELLTISELLNKKSSALFLDKEDWGQYFINTKITSIPLNSAYRGNHLVVFNSASSLIGNLNNNKEIDKYEFIVVNNNLAISDVNDFTLIYKKEIYSVFKRHN